MGEVGSSVDRVIARTQPPGSSTLDEKSRRRSATGLFSTENLPAGNEPDKHAKWNFSRSNY